MSLPKYNSSSGPSYGSRLTKVPVDESTAAQLKPTCAYFIRHLGKETNVLDLSEYREELFVSGEGKWAGLELDSAKKRAAEIAKSKWLLRKENLLGTDVVVKNFSEDGQLGVEVARWKSPLLSLRMGTTTISFLEDGSPGEEVSIAPTGILRRSEAFVKDGVTFIWNVERHAHENKHLYKIIGQAPNQKKVEVGRYSQKSGYATEGLLVLDGSEIEDLLGILTLCAVLEQVDSFTKEGIDKVATGLLLSTSLLS